MAGTIASLLVAYWFYNGAIKNNKKPIQWVFLGIIFYYGSLILWTYGVLRLVMGRDFVSHSVATGAFIEYSGIIVGIICAALAHRRFLGVK